MNTIFLPVFQVELLHSYYKNSLCADFELFPVSDTQQLMRNRQAVFSFRSTFGKMLMLGDGATAQHPLSTTDALVFGMTLLKPSLVNFTTEWPSPKKVFLFTNAGNLTDPSASPVTLLRSEISLSGKVIAHTIVSTLAVTLTLKNETGTTVSTASFAAGSGGREHLFDVQQLGNGLYTVTETTTSGSSDFVFYADNQLLFKNIFGLIRIVNQSTFPFNYDGKHIFRISFTPKTSKWKYYIVAPAMSGADLTSLNVVHTGATGPAVIGFTKTYPVPPADTTAPILLSDTSKIAIFTSNNPLTFQQAGRRQIELRKGATTLLAHLPNPDVSKPSGATTEIFVYV